MQAPSRAARGSTGASPSPGWTSKLALSPWSVIKEAVVTLPFSAPEPTGPGESTCIQPPTPCVRLYADHVMVTSTDGLSCDVDEVLVPLIELSFEYGGTRVRASDERPRVFRSDAGRLEAVDRDRKGEGTARRVIERLGAVELACVESITRSEERR